MPAERYVLKNGDDETLALLWEKGWKNLQVYWQNERIAHLPTRQQLENGESLPLPDGSVLHISLEKSLLSSRLALKQNGTELSPAGPPPEMMLGNVYGVLFFIAAFSLLAGIGAAFLDIRLLQSFGVGEWAIHFSLIFLLLGVLVRRRSTIALVIAIGVFVLDGMIETSFALNNGYGLPTMAILFRLILIVWVAQGFEAIRRLKEKEASH